MLDFCQDIREVAKPGALLLNYANPMAMNTWACNQYGGVDDDRPLPRRAGRRRADRRRPRREGRREQPGEVDIVCAGINHQTWYHRRQPSRPQDRPRRAGAASRRIPSSQQEKVRIDVLKRFGYSTESNGHLSEYLPWYRKRPDEITQWIDLSDWINGETGGYLRVCTESRNWFETDFPHLLAGGRPPIDPPRALQRAWHLHHRGAGNRAAPTAATSTSRTRRHHQPAGRLHHRDRPGYVDRFGINMVAGITLPLACAATCIGLDQRQRMSVHAAVTGDVDLLKLAVLHDPLVGAICTPKRSGR